jgi:hypothetical protein
MMSADDSHKHHNVADYGVALGKTGTDWWCAGRGRALSLSMVGRVVSTSGVQPAENQQRLPQWG